LEKSRCSFALISKVYSPFGLTFHHRYIYDEANPKNIFWGHVERCMIPIAKTPSKKFRPACQDQSRPDLHDRSQHLLSMRPQIQHHRVELDESFRLVIKWLTSDQLFMIFLSLASEISQLVSLSRLL
jgi:hypothetical protein